MTLNYCEALLSVPLNEEALCSSGIIQRVFVLMYSQDGWINVKQCASKRNRVCSVYPPWINKDLKLRELLNLSLRKHCWVGCRLICSQLVIIFRLTSLMSLCITEWSEVNKVRPGTHLHRPLETA